MLVVNLDIEYSESCEFDKLIIYDNKTELGTFMCGISPIEKVNTTFSQLYSNQLYHVTILHISDVFNVARK